MLFFYVKQHNKTLPISNKKIKLCCCSSMLSNITKLSLISNKKNKVMLFFYVKQHNKSLPISNKEIKLCCSSM